MVIYIYIYTVIYTMKRKRKDKTQMKQLTKRYEHEHTHIIVGQKGNNNTGKYGELIERIVVERVLDSSRVVVVVKQQQSRIQVRIEVRF